jgi:TrmH family RNA methyltransferase
MLSITQSKYIRSLHKKKYRLNEGAFLAEGKKLAKELIASDWEVELICALESWQAPDGAEGLAIIEVSEREMKSISALNTPSEVLVVAKIPAPTDIDLNDGFTLALDNIRDPGNLGTIIRTADWFGFKVVCSPECADLFNPKTVQATMGSLTRVPIQYRDLSELKDKQVLAADMNGESLYETTISAPAIILIGSESHGISSELEAIIDKRITIPAVGKAESLNAAMAAAVVCSRVRNA